MRFVPLWLLLAGCVSRQKCHDLTEGAYTYGYSMGLRHDAEIRAREKRK